MKWKLLFLHIAAMLETRPLRDPTVLYVMSMVPELRCVTLGIAAPYALKCVKHSRIPVLHSPLVNLFFLVPEKSLLFLD